VVGSINGQQFGVSRISANICHVDSGGNQLTATLTDIPPTIGNDSNRPALDYKLYKVV